ncbi:PTS sugar transporter subunit IIA [Rhizobium tubonense]|uniref:Protein-N(Pi)-phosphohistidine--sugar phosphotransferase n=1 Tax=Rhizobium tubonense TaxID=484088 RepID=A0A2W4CKP4_9HYPH|nr:PTS sugar transporter subunit IIA [Rhizobium tubonense]PZM11528.1 protein-N(pi)-phosphohistidine--sugar phosphotransferase [Rhizobium tubonense]
MDLSTIIHPEHVFIGLSAPTKWRALQLVSQKAATCLGVEEAVVLHALEARERLGTTGIGNGIAVPHAAIAGMTKPRGLIIRFAKPVDFEAIDNVGTDLVFMLLFGESGRGEYLNVLAAIARRLQTEGVLAAIRQAKTGDELYADFIGDALR